MVCLPGHPLRSRFACSRPCCRSLGLREGEGSALGRSSLCSPLNLPLEGGRGADAKGEGCVCTLGVFIRK